MTRGSGYELKNVCSRYMIIKLLKSLFVVLAPLNSVLTQFTGVRHI
jgi:hypothetical protein